MSNALQALKNYSLHQIPLAPIWSTYTDWGGFGSSSAAFAIRNFYCAKDPLAQYFTASGWPMLFQGAENDAIVSANSQSDGLYDPVVGVIGFVHSPGMEALGFVGPSVLDQEVIGDTVVRLLNRSWKNSSYYHMVAP